MGYTIILEAIMMIIKMIVKWSAKNDERQKAMLHLVKQIDGQVISDTKFRSEYRKIIVKQLEEIDRLDNA